MSLAKTKSPRALQRKWKNQANSWDVSVFQQIGLICLKYSFSIKNSKAKINFNFSILK